MQNATPWDFFPHFVLRSTGFPFEWMEQLRFADSLEPCRSAVDIEEYCERIRTAALQAMRTLAGDRELRKRVQKISRCLEQRMPMPPELTDLAARIEPLAGWNDLMIKRESLLAAVHDSFDAEFIERRQHLYDLVSTDMFQQAVFLSSPDMYKQSLREYLAGFDPARRPSDSKRLELKVFSYLQRFCGKNETASYFGPINYGTIEPGTAGHLTFARSGPGTVQSRETFLSFWGTVAMADAITSDPAVAPCIPPRLNPLCRVEDDVAVIQAVKRRLPLRPVHKRLLKLIDGTRTVHELASAFGAATDEVLAAVSILVRTGVLIHRLEVPTSTFHPLTHLIARVEALPDSCTTRAHWVGVLHQIDALRERFTTAPFGERPAILAELEALFEVTTGQKGRRGEGRMYADRTLLYEECHGTVSRFALNADMHNALRQKLGHAFNVAAALGKHQSLHWQSLAQDAFRAMSPELAPVPYADFLSRLQAQSVRLPAEPPCPLTEAWKERLVGWREQHPDSRAFDISAAELPVDEVPAPLYSLPDICIASESMEAMQRGDYEIVLARLHHHLLVWGWLLYFHGDRAQFEHDLNRFLEAHPLYAQMVHLQVIRRNKGFYDFPGRVVEFLSRSTKEIGDTLPMSDVFVTLENERLVLRRGETGEDLFLYLSLADQVGYMPFHAFALPPLTLTGIFLPGHTPRLLIDGVVCQRESWLLEPTDCAELLAVSGATLLIAGERFRRRHGMPHWVYVRTSLERKPYLVDFGNYFSLELLQSVIRRGGTLLFQEMLPAPNQLWLQDEHGRYSTELRMNCFKVANASVLPEGASPFDLPPSAPSHDREELSV